MLKLADGARYFEDGEVTGIDSLPSGSLGAIYEHRSEREVSITVMLIAMRNVDQHGDGDWEFHLSIDYTNEIGEWFLYKRIAETPISDTKMALSVESDQTRDFNSIVDDLQAHRGLVKIAEEYGLELIAYPSAV